MNDIDTLNQAYLKVLSIENSGDLTITEKQKCKFIKNKMRYLLRDLRDRKARQNNKNSKV